MPTGAALRHWLISLHDLVEKKQAVVVAVHILDGIVAVSQLGEAVKTLDAAAQTEFQNMLGEGYVIEEHFRDAEKTLTEAEADYAKELEEVRLDWGDRLEATLMGRLESASNLELTDWFGQVEVDPVLRPELMEIKLWRRSVQL